MSRSFQDHFAAKMSSKLTGCEPNSDVTRTSQISCGERVKRGMTFTFWNSFLCKVICSYQIPS